MAKSEDRRLDRKISRLWSSWRRVYREIHRKTIDELGTEQAESMGIVDDSDEYALKVLQNALMEARQSRDPIGEADGPIDRMAPERGAPLRLVPPPAED